MDIFDEGKEGSIPREIIISPRAVVHLFSEPRAASEKV